jgi:Arm DNA-binding domain
MRVFTRYSKHLDGMLFRPRYLSGNWFEGPLSARCETKVAKVKLELTDSVIRSLKPHPTKRKYTVWDTTGDPTGLGVRIRSTAVKTYVVLARPRPTDRQIMVTLSRAGTMKLAAARKLAWDAHHQMQRGLNPNQEKRKLVVESFGALAEMYMTEELPQKRQGHQVARYIRADWLGHVPHQTKTWQGLRSVWKIEWKDSKDAIFRDRPAALITREDILARLNTIRRTRGSYAGRHQRMCDALLIALGTIRVPTAQGFCWIVGAGLLSFRGGNSGQVSYRRVIFS